MSEEKRNSFYSPMECIFESFAHVKSVKRKSDGDSGYQSPYSSLRFDQTQFGSCSSDERVKVGFRKNLFGESQDESTSSTLPGVSTYSDFLLDASLYKPMETNESLPSVMQVDSSVFKDVSSLPLMEISKDIEMVSPISDVFVTPSSTIEKPTKINLNRKTSLIGFEHVDFFHQLAIKSNHQHIVSKILNYLSDKDIASLTMVSKTHKIICLSDPTAKSRWRNYTKERKSKKENLWVQHKLFKTNLEPLRVRNTSTPLLPKQSSSPPVSPSKARFWMFYKEARLLKDDETLMQCPRCTRPAVCNRSLQTGRCSSDLCQYTFCSLCQCAEHSGNSSCASLSPTTPTKIRSLSFKQRKARLRRLL